MSEYTETPATDPIQDIMVIEVNAAEISPTEDPQIVQAENENDTSQERTQDPNMTITEILEKVALLAEGLEEALHDFQIGDYVVSMNASPLEIQVKQAVVNIALPDDPPILPKVISNGEGDGDQLESKTSDNIEMPQPVEETELMTTDDQQGNWINPSRDIHNEVMGTLKRKKSMSVIERLRRILRFSFRRRRN